MWRAQGGLILGDVVWNSQECLSFETWWQRWCTVEPHAWDRGANVSTAHAAAAAETVDGGDVTGLVKRGAIDVPTYWWWGRAIDAPEKELCERELGGRISGSGAVLGSLRSCVQK